MPLAIVRAAAAMCCVPRWQLWLQQGHAAGGRRDRAMALRKGEAVEGQLGLFQPSCCWPSCPTGLRGSQCLWQVGPPTTSLKFGWATGSPGRGVQIEQLHRPDVAGGPDAWHPCFIVSQAKFIFSMLPCICSFICIETRSKAEIFSTMNTETLQCK